MFRLPLPVPVTTQMTFSKRHLGIIHWDLAHDAPHFIALLEKVSRELLHAGGHSDFVSPVACFWIFASLFLGPFGGGGGGG